MDTQELRKFLAGLGIAGLLAGTSLTAGGCASTGWDGKKDDAKQAPAASS